MTEFETADPTIDVPPSSGGGGGTIAEAGSFAKERVEELKQNLNEGNFGLRILVLLGAVAMIITSIIGIVSDSYRIDTIAVLIDIYTLLLAVMMVVLEYGNQLSFFAAYESSLYKNALFLKFVWGRGFFYFFAGSLEVSRRHIMNLIVGGYVCILGLAFVIVGRSAANKLAAARRSAFSSEELESKYQQADVEGAGLTREQFGVLIGLLGMDLTRREIETTFLQLDTDGRVSFSAVLGWWNTGNATEDYSVAPGDYVRA